jgi:hypothetical protein
MREFSLAHGDLERIKEVKMERTESAVAVALGVALIAGALPVAAGTAIIGSTLFRLAILTGIGSAMVQDLIDGVEDLAHEYHLYKTAYEQAATVKDAVDSEGTV